MCLYPVPTQRRHIHPDFLCPRDDGTYICIACGFLQRGHVFFASDSCGPGCLAGTVVGVSRSEIKCGIATRGRMPRASGERENELLAKCCVASASLIKTRGGNQDAHWLSSKRSSALDRTAIETSVKLVLCSARLLATFATKPVYERWPVFLSVKALPGGSATRTSR